MAKKRRTKQQKIIARLRRQLNQQKLVVEKTPTPISQSKELKKIKRESASNGNELFFYDSSLIKKDLSKTAFFSLVILTIIGLIKFFHL